MRQSQILWIALGLARRYHTVSLGFLSDDHGSSSQMLASSHVSVTVLEHDKPV